MKAPKIKATAFMSTMILCKPWLVVHDVESYKYHGYKSGGLVTLRLKSGESRTFNVNGDCESSCHFGLVIDPNVLKSVMNNRKYLRTFYPDGHAYVETYNHVIYEIDFLKDMSGDVLYKQRGAYDAATVGWAEVIRFATKEEYDNQVYYDPPHDGFRD